MRIKYPIDLLHAKIFFYFQSLKQAFFNTNKSESERDHRRATKFSRLPWITMLGMDLNMKHKKLEVSLLPLECQTHMSMSITNRPKNFSFE
jgi:hypothetical protein